VRQKEVRFRYRPKFINDGGHEATRRLIALGFPFVVLRVLCGETRLSAGLKFLISILTMEPAEKQSYDRQSDRREDAGFGADDPAG
jgi:hypothetical protein